MDDSREKGYAAKGHCFIHSRSEVVHVIIIVRLL